MSIANEIRRLQTAKANIKSAIESKGVTVGDGTIDTYAEKINEISVGGGDYDQGYEDGKNSVVPIERYLKIAQFTSLNMFGKSEAILNLDSITNLNGLCSATTQDSVNTTVEHLIINCPNLVASLNTMLQGSTTAVDNKLKRVTLNVDTQKATSFNSAFAFLNALEVIDGSPLNAASCTVGLNSCFRQCRALIEVRFVPNTIKNSFSSSYSPNLSTETIQSIIDGLADLSPKYYEARRVGDTVFENSGILIENIISAQEDSVFTMVEDGSSVYYVEYGTEPPYIYSGYACKKGGGTAQTLTVHKTVGEKLTDEQKATITAKNWTLVY